MPPRFSFSLLSGLIWVSLASIAAADTLTMKNGDTLSGEVVNKSGKLLRFKTTYAGTLEITWSEVRDLQMDELTEVVLDDDFRLQATSVRAGGESVGSVGAKDAGIGVAAERIDKIKPKPWEVGRGGKFTGKVNFAAKLEGGNSEQDEIDTDFELAYRRGKHRFRSHGQLEFDKNDGDTTKQDWFLLGKYDYFFTEHVYFTGTYNVKQEKYADLDLRQFGGPGIGYQFLTGPPTTLLSEVGLAYYHEEFSDGETNSFVGPNWYLNYEQQLFKGKLKFYHKNLATISMDEISKQLWHSWTGFSVPIVGGIIGSTEMEMDYDSKPADDAEKLDTTFRLKLGYEW